MENKAKILFTLLAATCLTACSSSDDETVAPPAVSRPITVEVSETPLVSADSAASRQTRAAITTESSLSQFYIDYSYTLAGDPIFSDLASAVKRDGDKWRIGIGWPESGNDVQVNWYAYTFPGKDPLKNSNANVSKNDNGSPCLSFTVEESATSQKDLLVATTSGTYEDSKGKLTFVFSHACSALRFSVKKATNLSAYTLKIKEVTLCHVVKYGEYNFSSGNWDLGSNGDYTNYTLYYNSEGKELDQYNYAPLNSSEDYLFLLPQTFTPWNHVGELANTYLKINCTITDDQGTVHNGDAYIPFEKTIEKGVKYDVQINIGKNSLYKVENSTAKKIID